MGAGTVRVGRPGVRGAATPHVMGRPVVTGACRPPGTLFLAPFRSSRAPDNTRTLPEPRAALRQPPANGRRPARPYAAPAGMSLAPAAAASLGPRLHGAAQVGRRALSSCRGSGRLPLAGRAAAAANARSPPPPRRPPGGRHGAGECSRPGPRLGAPQPPATWRSPLSSWSSCGRRSSREMRRRCAGRPWESRRRASRRVRCSTAAAAAAALEPRCGA